MNKERLLNVAKALRESKDPNKFTMARYVHPCGTPACAFGHYAAREDLQDEFSINTEEHRRRYSDQGVHIRETGEEVCYDNDAVLNHFDATYEQLAIIFENDGCALAKTASEAADYIERFAKTDDFSNTP